MMKLALITTIISLWTVQSLAAVGCNGAHARDYPALSPLLGQYYRGEPTLNATNLVTSHRLGVLENVLRSNPQNTWELKIGFLSLVEQVVLAPQIKDSVLSRLVEQNQRSILDGRTQQISDVDLNQLLQSPHASRSTELFKNTLRGVKTSLESLNRFATEALHAEYPRFSLAYDNHLNNIEKNMTNLVRWAKLERDIFGSSEIIDQLMPSIQTLSEKMGQIDERMKYPIENQALERERQSQYRIYESVQERILELWLIAFEAKPTLGGN